jgi:hypothetical protein
MDRESVTGLAVVTPSLWRTLSIADCRYSDIRRNAEDGTAAQYKDRNVISFRVDQIHKRHELQMRAGT